MVTMPMAFCASFEPCESAMEQLERSWSALKDLLTRVGAKPFTIQVRRTMIAKPAMRPKSGERTRNSTTVFTPFDVKTEKTPVEKPSEKMRCIMTAPQSPPTSACELDDGIPKYHVMRFQ